MYVANCFQLPSTQTAFVSLFPFNIQYGKQKLLNQNNKFIIFSGFQTTTIAQAEAVIVLQTNSVI